MMLPRDVVMVMVAAFLAISGCDPRSERAMNRMERAAMAQGDIQIAMVWPQQDRDGFMAGGELAAAQINEAGGMLGRRLRLVVVDEQDDRTDPAGLAPMRYEPVAAATVSSPTHQYRAAAPTRALAQELARNLDLVAVVGHRRRAGAAMASAIYEYNQLLYLAPAVTDLSLTDHAFQLTFRTISNNAQIVQRLVAFAARAGYRELVLLMARNPYGEEVSRLLLRQAQAADLKIVHHRSFFPGLDDPNRILAEFRHKKADAIFIAGVYGEMEPLLIQSRSMGITLPFVMPTDLEADRTFRPATLPKGRLFYPSFFQVDSKRAATQRFVERFRDTYGLAPDVWAAQGYEAIHLLAEAMTQSASTMPRIVASYLRYMHQREGVVGGRIFALDGQMTGMPIGIKVAHDGKLMRVSESVCAGPFPAASYLRMAPDRHPGEVEHDDFYPMGRLGVDDRSAGR
jgi:branched-chain amino acid transport system substrate-binding protein